MTTPLPDPGEASVDDHVQMSRIFLEHAHQELDHGDRLQASEKIWGATSHALKAIAIQRGWRHRSNATIFDIGEQLAREFGREDDFDRYLTRAGAMHQNFYDNDRREPAIQLALADVEEFVAELGQIRESAPRSFTVRDANDRDRLGNLLGLSRPQRPAIGSTHPHGFSQLPDDPERQP